MGLHAFRSNLLTNNLPQKLIALFAALVIWFLVHHGITTTKTISNIPVRIVNLPANLTVPGIMPNGVYSKRITLTLTGSQEVLDTLEPGDFEVQLDAGGRQPGDWEVAINRKNLMSLTPDTDLSEYITEVRHGDFPLQISRLLVAQVPITLIPFKDNPPKGFQFLDVWPAKLFQTVSGPEDVVGRLVSSGLELELDLAKIRPAELEEMASLGVGVEDEASFMVPADWKNLSIPSLGISSVAINDPAADLLRINFLRETLIPLNRNLPLLVFYPLDSSSEINPKTASLAINGLIQEKDQIPFLARPLFISGASRRFVEIVQSQLSITVNARPRKQGEKLSWNVQLVNPRAMEDLFVSLLTGEREASRDRLFDKQYEQFLRTRFRDYLQNLRLYTGKDRKLTLNCQLEGNQIRISTDQSIAWQ
jgi:hypothetical protein